jgi:phosphatidylethanolamine/phosphatidyl-N-methylethanolamine N-methyltransferase
MRIWSEWKNFIRVGRRHFHTTGAVLPSSPFLANALVSALSQPRGPARILEVGPGTGAVTQAIARAMRPDDTLDAVEINDQFVRLLEERIRTDPVFAPRRDRIRVLHSPLADVPGHGVYDFIVSGLPCNIFPVELVRNVYAAYRRLLKPGGTLSFFEYTWIREMKTPFVGRHERRRLNGVGQIVGENVRQFQVRCQRIFINVPPATVRHLRFQPAGKEC